VGLDGLVGVDGFVAEGHVDVLVAGDDLGDVRGQPGHDRVGDEDPAEVVRGALQRAAVGGGQPGGGERGVEHLADGPCADPAVLGAVLALEQHWRGRQPGAFLRVVGRHQGHRAGAALAADSTSAMSGLITKSRSVSVLDGAICSSGTISPVAGSRYCTRL
jgi:hypothetical protein